MRNPIEVRIDLNHGSAWTIQYDGNPASRFSPDSSSTMVIDKSFVDQYEATATLYFAMQEKLEQLYRIQEKMEPWPWSEHKEPLPEHKLI